MKTAACKAGATLAISLEAIANAHLANFSGQRQMPQLWNLENLLTDNQYKPSTKRI